jgi:hypothetical protein
MARLRRAIARSPLALPMIFDEQIGPAHLAAIGGTLAPVLVET